MKISVVICTHNPREVYFTRILNALRKQTLATDKWELILIDNCSSTPIDSVFDVSWHPQGRVLMEDQLGLTHARLRGIRESSGEILCFVDDDNVLEPEYLEEALHIGIGQAHIGCWGGEILPEFETQPPAWLENYKGMLVIRPLERDKWGNAYYYGDAMPCGAGLCIRRSVVDEYLRICELSPIRKTLGRSGTSMASAEDLDMAFTAIDMGMGTGRFKVLKMLHLIPAGRLRLDYITRLAEGMEESEVFLHSFRSADTSSITAKTGLGATILFMLSWLKSPKEKRRVMMAQRRGRLNGLKKLLGMRCMTAES